MQDIVKYEADEKQWTRLLPTQRLVAHIVQILLSNKTLKEGIIKALAEYYSPRKRRAQDKHFQYLRYNFLLSPHSSTFEESAKQNAEQIVEEMERLFLTLLSQSWHICENKIKTSFRNSHQGCEFHSLIRFWASQVLKTLPAEYFIESLSYRFRKCVLYSILKIEIFPKSQKLPL